MTSRPGRSSLRTGHTHCFPSHFRTRFSDHGFALGGKTLSPSSSAVMDGRVKRRFASRTEEYSVQDRVNEEKVKYPPLSYEEFSPVRRPHGIVYIVIVVPFTHIRANHYPSYETSTRSGHELLRKRRQPQPLKLKK